jgi:hypothetical protein
MKLYNLIFQIVIPFLTQPPHERTLTGRGSRVYPKCWGSRVYPNGRGSIQIVHLNSLTAMVAYLRPLFFRASC